MTPKTLAVTIGELVTAFLFSIQTEGKSPRTHQYYEWRLHHFQEYARQQSWPERVAEIDANKIREYLSWVGSRSYDYSPAKRATRTVKASPKTAWPYFKALRRLFNWAMDQGFALDNPTRFIRFKTPPAALIEAYSEEELRSLIAVCDGEMQRGERLNGLRNKAILLLFVDSGLRLKELVDLRLGDLNMGQQIVRVVGKGGRPDCCPFSPTTAKAISLYLIERKTMTQTDALWVRHDGKPLSSNGLATWFTKAKRLAGINSPGLIHRLRHTAALQYLRGAHNSFLLQLFLRHLDLAMSRRYTQGLKHEEAILAHRNGASPVERMKLL